MFDVGMSELILIFVIALIVFGPKKLPEIGKSLGKAMHDFKQATNEFKEKLESEAGTAGIKEELLAQHKDIQTAISTASSLDVKQEPVEASAAASEEPRTVHVG